WPRGEFPLNRACFQEGFLLAAGFFLEGGTGRAERAAEDAAGGRSRANATRGREQNSARSATDPGAPRGGGARSARAGAPRGPFNIAPVLCELRASKREALRAVG